MGNQANRAKKIVRRTTPKPWLGISPMRRWMRKRRSSRTKEIPTSDSFMSVSPLIPCLRDAIRPGGDICPFRTTAAPTRIYTTQGHKSPFLDPLGGPRQQAARLAGNESFLGGGKSCARQLVGSMAGASGGIGVKAAPTTISARIRTGFGLILLLRSVSIRAYHDQRVPAVFSAAICSPAISPRIRSRPYRRAS